MTTQQEIVDAYIITYLSEWNISINNKILYLDDLYWKMSKLLVNIDNSAIYNIPYIPNGVEHIIYNNNKFMLPELPISLKKLTINHPTYIPELPHGLEELDCFAAQIKQFPKLPDTLIKLTIDYSKICQLPILPSGLQYYKCKDIRIVKPVHLHHYYSNDSKNISKLQELPRNLKELHCDNNSIKALPDLPPTLEVLNCSSNLLQNLPD